MTRLTTTLTATAILLALSSHNNATAGDSVTWANNLEEARSLALQQNKLLLIHFWAPDCPPCKTVDKNVFPSQHVSQTINRHYVALKVNARSDTAIRDHFGVQSWPTDVIATIDGKAVHRLTTPQNPNQYVKALSEVAAQNRNVQQQVRNESIQVASPAAGTTQPKWSNSIAPPDLSETEARARRPGISPSMGKFDAPLGGPMVPGPTTANSPRFSGNVRPQRPGQITNRFANANRFESRQTQANSVRATISNPYAVANTGRPGAIKPPQQQPTATKAPQLPTLASNIQQQDRSKPAPMPSKLPPAPEAGFGLDGRCPVTLVTEGRWVKGVTQWGAVHRGHTYLFAGPEQQQQFLSNPDEFSPVLAGMDVVALAQKGRIVQGNRRFGVLYDNDGIGPNANRIYLFDSEASRNRFEKEPETFVQPVMQALQQNRLNTLLR